MLRSFLILAAFFGFTGVALGAFAAHGLKNRLSADYLAIFHTGVTYQLVHALALFGVALLVAHESDVPLEGDASDTWHDRKTFAINLLKGAERDVKVVAMGDKLSNMRAIARDYAAIGDEIWNLFNVKDKAEHAWHYHGLADALSDLSDTPAYQEFYALVKSVFG